MVNVMKLGIGAIRQWGRGFRRQGDARKK